MIPDFKTFINESVWVDMHKRSNGSLERKEDKLSIDEMEDFIDRSLHRYAKLYVIENWENDGVKLTYDTFATAVKTSDSMQDINYENYTEEQLDSILRYTKKKWDVYSKELEDYIDDEKLPF